MAAKEGDSSTTFVANAIIARFLKHAKSTWE